MHKGKCCCFFVFVNFYVISILWKIDELIFFSLYIVLIHSIELITPHGCR